MENIINIIYLAMSALSLMITIGVLLKRKKTANNEEKEKIDELILLNVKNALQNAQTTLRNLNIKCDSKTVMRTAKRALKESINDGKTENA